MGTIVGALTVASTMFGVMLGQITAGAEMFGVLRRACAQADAGLRAAHRDDASEQLVHAWTALGDATKRITLQDRPAGW